MPREGVGHPHGYSFHFVQEYLIRSTPVVSAQRVPETTFRLPHVSDIKSLTPRHMRKAPDGALFSHVPREGVEHYMFSTPIGWIDALRFQSNSIGLRLPHVSDIESLTPRHMIKAPDGALFSHVPREGVEPSRLATHDFESCAYTNSATEAFNFYQSRII